MNRYILATVLLNSYSDGYNGVFDEPAMKPVFTCEGCFAFLYVEQAFYVLRINMGEGVT